MNIPDSIRQVLDENPKIGRHRLSKQCSIPLEEARYWCHLYKKGIQTPIQQPEKQELSEDDLIYEIEKKGYFVTKDAQKQDYTFKPDIRPFQGDVYRIGIVSDTQLGSQYQQLTHLHSFYRYCQEQGIRYVFHAGDLVDGQSLYRGQEFELFLHGADSQIEYAIQYYPEYDDITTFLVCGNHDESHWKRAGVDVGKAISKDRKDIEYKGFHGAYFSLGDIDKLIYVHHGSGGVAYARSYKLQKLIEQLAPDQKPFFLFDGHYHVSSWLPMYRNVCGWQLPCFQSQTPYLKARGLYPEIGGLIMEFRVNGGKPTVPKFEFVPFYIPVKEDF